jgi:ATP phosphoribosyltransferase regulatory subunit
VHLDLTDRGIFLALMQADPGLAQVEEAVLAALALKDRPRLMDSAKGLKASTRLACEALLGLYGPAAGPNNVIERARSVLPPIAQIREALDRLERVASSALFVQHPRCALTVDLADLVGWRYHNGIMFSISSKAWPDAIVRGGRYDGVGEAFGRARPATGFSLELRALASLVDSADADSHKTESAVAAPWRDEVPLREAIAGLRGRGRRVVCLPEGELAHWTGPRLKPSGSGWVLAETS